MYSSKLISCLIVVNFSCSTLQTEGALVRGSLVGVTSIEKSSEHWAYIQFACSLGLIASQLDCLLFTDRGERWTTISLDGARHVWRTTCCMVMTALRGGSVGTGRRRPPLAPLPVTVLPSVLARGPRGKTLDIRWGLVTIGVVALELPAHDSTSDISCPGAIYWTHSTWSQVMRSYRSV